jgi:LysR family cyn operon transcriptional activator
VNLRNLRTFVATAELGGLGRACSRLNLSQPAASRQIDALESELGLVLFQRLGRRLQLTSEGGDLLQQSRRLLADADLIVDRARTLKGGQAGTLRVAAPPQLIASVLAPFLPRYRERNPGVEVHLIEGSADSQRMRLERGEVHLAILASSERGFSRRLLLPIYVLAAFLKTHRLARRRIVEVADLADEPLLLLQRDYATRIKFDHACESAHVSTHVQIECTATSTLIELAAVGYGTAVVPSTALLRPEMRARPLALRGTAIGHWSTICWDPKRLMPPYIERFVDQLVTHSHRNSLSREFLRQAPSLPRPVEFP